jgi:parallel beta-helix repeat protein
MGLTSFKIFKSVFIFFSLCVLLSHLSGCGSGADTTDDSAYGTGSISFGLAWEDGSSNTISSSLSKALSPSGDVCADYGIDTITGKVYNSSNTEVASASWSCSAHQGALTCPAGTGMRLVLEGIVAGSVDWRGEKTGITVTAGSTTNAGTVTMNYIDTYYVAWINEGDSIVKVASSRDELLKIDTINCESMSAYTQFALDPNDYSLWIADTNNNRIIKLDEQGKLVVLIDQYSAQGTAVDPRDGSVWSSYYDSATSRNLKKRDSIGLIVIETAYGLSGSMMDNAMSWDTGDNSLWFADYSTYIFKLFGTDAELSGYNLSGSSGTNHLRIGGFTGQPFTVSVYPGSTGHVWASDRDGAVLQFSTTGSLNLNRAPSGITSVDCVSADISDGSVWLGGSGRVAKYSSAGDSLINAAGFTGFETIEADPFDGGAWVGLNNGLIKISSSGTEEWRRTSGAIQSIALQKETDQRRTIYVSNSGSDINGDGSQGNPYGTIGKGTAEAASGDTVSVAAGTYNENVSLKNGVRIIGAGSGITTIQGLGTAQVVDGTAVQNAEISGFTITGSSSTTSGMYCADCTGLVIRQNSIIDNGDSTTSNGILLTGASTALIEHNVITGNATSGITIGGTSRVIVRNNIIAQNSDCGIFHNSSGTSYIINNVIDRNGTVSGGRSGILTWEPDVIMNNIITNNGYASYNTSVGIYVASGAIPIISYNNVWGNFNGDYYGVSAGNGDISSDPLFNTAPGDYHLQAGSPSINAGDPNIYDEGVDCSDYTNRRNDMGAYGGPWGNW